MHRERRRASHVAAGEQAPDGSLAATYRKLAEAGLGDDEVGIGESGIDGIQAIFKNREVEAAKARARAQARYA